MQQREGRARRGGGGLVAGFGEQGVAGQAFAPLPGVVEVAGAEGGAGGHGEGVGVFVDGGGGVGGRW
ncbi:hypothetical protein [Streptomyces sp. R02]|uniref:Uncharacterized protein n=1 Tax=Streptomyces sp. R02 TaxID=3238623 RepID=A0AB39LYX8_9ACTN